MEGGDEQRRQQYWNGSDASTTQNQQSQPVSDYFSASYPNAGVSGRFLVLFI